MRFFEPKVWEKIEESRAASERGEHAQAARFLLSAAFRRENDDLRLAAEIYVSLAKARFAEGDIERTHVGYNMALMLAEDNRVFMAWVLSEQAAAFEAIGAYSTAASVTKEAAWELGEITYPSPKHLPLYLAHSLRRKNYRSSLNLTPTMATRFWRQDIRLSHL